MKNLAKISELKTQIITLLEIEVMFLEEQSKTEIETMIYKKRAKLEAECAELEAAK